MSLCERTRIGVVAAILAVMAAACGNGGGPPKDAQGELLLADVARQTQPAATDPLVDGLTAFGYDLARTVDRPTQNTVISPLSVAVALSMARVGARGATAAEIDRVLHFPAGDRDAAFNTLTRELITQDGSPPRVTPAPTRSPDAPPAAPMVAVANGLFAQAGLPVGRKFLHTLAAQYGAGVRTVDFGSAQATETINAWVRTQTADRIRRLFDSLDPATRLVLANAVYLKADWARPFAEHPTTKEAFTRADGSTVRVPTMHQQATLRYAAGPGWQAVELPYAGGELAMWVLLPTDGAAPGPLLAPATLRTVADQLHDQRVAVALPRFDFATDLDLVTALQQLGLHTAFGPDADFSGIVPGLFISQAVHRANITVDEWGTEAAAVTGLAFAISAAPPPQVTVRADHPFAFAIVHRPTRAPVFMGVVAQPSTR